jgi:hypothetical protein
VRPELPRIFWLHDHRDESSSIVGRRPASRPKMKLASGPTSLGAAGLRTVGIDDVPIERSSLGRTDGSAISRHAVSDGARSVVPKLVCILSVGRTGTNHLAKILSHIPEIDSRRELFNLDRIWWMHPHELAEFSRRVGKALPCSPESRQTVNTVRRRPGLALDCLVDMLAPEKRVLTFKVFVNQLTVRQVKKAIIRRPDTVIIFIRRRPIDTYISHRKASQLRQWVRVDTTDIKVNIDVRRFLKWWRQTSAWYRGLEAACWSTDKPFYELTYESDIAMSPMGAARRFCAILEDCGLGPFTLPRDDLELGLTQQDRSKDVRDRMVNWPEFQRHLTTRGSLAKAFEPIPHYQPTRWDRLCRRLLA